jgi:hypothetical protein
MLTREQQQYTRGCRDKISVALLSKSVPAATDDITTTNIISVTAAVLLPPEKK